MKKLLLSAAFVCVASVGVNAQQTVLSQTGGGVPTTGTIACGNNQAPSSAENSYFRSYTMTANMTIDAVHVGVGNAIGNVPITVKLHKSASAFPGSYPAGLTLLGSATATLVDTDDLSAVEVSFTTPISVASGEIIVVEVNNAATTAGNALYMGVVETSETAPAYIMASTCSIATPTTFAAVSATANGKVVIDLVQKGPVSSTDFFIENFNLYPNPVNNVLNIASKNGLNVNEVRITDLSGKVVKTQKDVSSINVSDLATGTYIIDVTTNEGRATSKFIKK